MENSGFVVVIGWKKNNNYVIYPECSKYPDRRCLEPKQNTNRDAALEGVWSTRALGYNDIA